MKKHLSIIVLVFTLIFFSCKQEKKEKSNSEITQMERVMNIHDEVMPKMSTIGKLVAKLKPMVDTTESGLKYHKGMEDLQNSHKAMMDWMKGFGDRFNSDEILKGKQLSKEKQLWLNEEEEKVKALKTQINTSITNAELLLKDI